MVRLFKSRKADMKRAPSRRTTREPPRRGKKRLPMSKGRKRANKQITRLQKSGYRKASRRPVGTLSDTEWRNLQKKVKGKDIEVVLEPPTWDGEAPREWILYRGSR